MCKITWCRYFTQSRFREAGRSVPHFGTHNRGLITTAGGANHDPRTADCQLAAETRDSVDLLLTTLERTLIAYEERIQSLPGFFLSEKSSGQNSLRRYA